MVSQIIIGTILLCLCTFAQQFNAVYGVALEDHLNSYDSTRDSIGHLSDVMKSSHYNSSILSDLLDSVDSLSTLINRKTNEFVAKLCNLNTVSWWSSGNLFWIFVLFSRGRVLLSKWALFSSQCTWILWFSYAICHRRFFLFSSVCFPIRFNSKESTIFSSN